jgi:hypothetical protein
MRMGYELRTFGQTVLIQFSATRPGFAEMLEDAREVVK